jgi:hypothetical protein
MNAQRIQENSMQRNFLGTIAAAGLSLVLLLAAAGHAQAQDPKTHYPVMAPLDQYLMDRNAEVSMARSAAPESISHDAEIMVLTRHGYEIAAKGKNGFVCMVQRSWTAGTDDPDFWNPKLRAPICFNPPAARFNVPLVVKKTELILATPSKEHMAEGIKTAFDKRELHDPESGAMCYMLSKQGYLSDRDGRWHPHVMFFLPLTEPAAWGANFPGSPVLGEQNPADHHTLFLIPLDKWSDGTPASSSNH